MKKIFALMTSLVMAASLAACGEEEVVVDDSVNSSVESSVSSEESSVEEGGQDTTEGSFNVLDLPGVEGPDVRNTTWSFAGGCEDGVPLTEERAYAALEAYGGTLRLYLMKRTVYRWYRVAALWQVLIRPMRIVPYY